MKKILLTFSLLLFSNLCMGDAMNQTSMENIIKNLAQESKGKRGFIEFNYNNVKMYLISDVKHNRMRIISAVAKYNELSIKHLDAILESNFHKSLDARYAVSNGTLYSAYIHPLSELHSSQIKSAVEQVANLALSFGKGYSSGILRYVKKTNASN